MPDITPDDATSQVKDHAPDLDVKTGRLRRYQERVENELIDSRPTDARHMPHPAKDLYGIYYKLYGDEETA